MADRPSGTVSLLFTDIENSTRLWEEQPAAMRDALARHDDVVRTAVESTGGYVFATGGDGFAVAFQRASDAVTAAIAAQKALQGEAWTHGLDLKVRMGVHSGEADERGGDYFGPPVNRAARVMGAARGTQIVVSATTVQLVDGSAGADFVDLGQHRLKGLAEDVHLFAVRADGLVAIDHPLANDVEVRGNLPHLATEFVGRVDVLRNRVMELADRRLVTLTGPGGVGKTRTAIEVGWLTVDQFPGGVWMIDLAPVADPDAVVPAVASTLSVQPQATIELLASIVDWMGSRRMLLILDNCEHVLTVAKDLVVEIVAGCPTVTVLATSREPLGITGERVVAVGSLPIDDAVSLFRERVEAADASVTFAPEDHSTLVSICERLDGIPLAVELAAARARSLSLDDLAARLEDRFRLLRGGGRGGLERHQTLRATVAWSYQLLTEPERLLFDRTTVFAGGFDLDAAEAVGADDDDIDPDDVVDLLSLLVDKSMVMVDRTGSALRYRLLETLRQYGEERLDQRGETAAVRTRHLAHYVVRAQRARELQTGPRQLEGDAFYDREWDNLRAAQEWSVASGDLDAAQDLVHGTFLSAWQHMRLDVVAWTNRLLESHDPGLDIRGSTYQAAGTWAYMSLRGRNERKDQEEMARLGIERDSDPCDTAVCGYLFAVARLQDGDPDSARRALEAADTAAARTPDPYGRYWVATGWVVLRAALGQAEAYSEAVDRLVAVAERAQAPWMVNGAQVSKGFRAVSRGEYGEAVDTLRSAHTLAADLGATAFQGVAGAALARTLLVAPGGVPGHECHALLEEVYDARFWMTVWQILDAVTFALARRGELEPSALILGHLDQEADLGTGDLLTRRHESSALVRADPQADEWLARGAAMSADAIVALALDRLSALT